MTPLPDPHPDAYVGNSIDGWTGAYTEEQMLAYGKAERQRALEEAALLCDGIAQRNWATTLAAQCADAIRALKEKP